MPSTTLSVLLAQALRRRVEAPFEGSVGAAESHTRTLGGPSRTGREGARRPSSRSLMTHGAGDIVHSPDALVKNTGGVGCSSSRFRAQPTCVL